MTAQTIDHITRVAGLFKLLSDPTRCKILNLLIENKEGMCVYELAEAVDVSHSAASHQLAKLEARDIVECFRDGQSFCYNLRDTETTRSLKKVIGLFGSQ